MSSKDVLGDHCLMFFPGNFMWSQAILSALGLIPFGAAEAGEIFKTARKLLPHEGDNERWFQEWTATAEETEALARKEEEQKHLRTAGGAYLRASSYHLAAERFISPKDPRKLSSYQQVIEAFRKGASYRLPDLERVEIPYEGTSLAAYFLPGQTMGEGAGRTMIFFDGLDACKEKTALYAQELAQRQINTLVVDGPGQGESLRIRCIPSRFDYEVPARAALDYLARRPNVDPNRIGIMALSMGGYYAPRAAAMEPRLRLCVAWNAHFDYHEVWLTRRRVLERGGNIASAPSFQLAWVLGAEDMDNAMEKLKKYTLAGIAEKISCPLLITHGENDSIVPVEMAYRLFKAAGSHDKTLKIGNREEGGSEHCGADNMTRTVMFIVDWIADRL